MPILRDDKARATREGLKLRDATASCTRASVLAETAPRPDMAREAVPKPTPARRATSLMVAIGV